MVRKPPKKFITIKIFRASVTRVENIIRGSRQPKVPNKLLCKR